MDQVLRALRTRPAPQQPEWPDPLALREVKNALGERPALVRAADVRQLRLALALVAAGRAQVVQAGDCAEDPAESTREDVARKAGLLDVLAGALQMVTRKPVVRAGRIAGQYAKPRSQPTEQVGGVTLPAYRGHLVNGPEPDPELRRPDPQRLLTGYDAAGRVLGHLGWRGGRPESSAPVWSSHEALVLDYELPLVRTDETGHLLLSSTHWPWIGERTRQLEGPHLALLATVCNPVACKVGPAMEPEELTALCARLDPRRTPGRLTLIARMGADAVADRLPPLVAAVRASGHPAIWLSDPLHGNTLSAPGGWKTRLLPTVVSEVRRFQTAVAAGGGTAGGLHLETTPDQVTECADDSAALASTGDKYTSFCDPRLNPAQALAVVHGWQE
ncbi:3-deoxy-7-phosphoheptulonate synthase [Streptomyces xiaopingdaonensis]|uniref:3-deoxy-7-phosphoheptulonate synthase n=1 Tax=Streptomyces xiaopingdaonensis TaxID=1565415 RepID=UPI0002F1BC92|nr:3-deoxy-7-phosphoheptulonate synthase [Streptomyces xiaopingdaonensis]